MNSDRFDSQHDPDGRERTEAQGAPGIYVERISAEILADRRARFQAQLGEGVAILPGGQLVRRVNDVDHVFRQRSDLLYLTGFAHPDALAVLSARRFVLFVQPKDPEAETWTGRRPGVEGAVANYGADEAYAVSELGGKLPALLENVPRLYHRFGDDASLDSSILKALEQVRGRARTGVMAPAEIHDPYAILHEMRLRKDAHELALMRRAAEITASGHHAAARRIREGAFEYELEAELFHAFRGLGGAGPAYPSIVASGVNSTILHYTENQSRLASGETVLIDAGAEFGGYAADVTRVYPVGGRFEGPARDVYLAVLAAQESALAAVRVGGSLRDVHDSALRSLAESLIELGVLSGTPDEVLEKETYRPFYMHGTSHFLGLDVHDAGAPMIEGKPRPLEPGMVFTVEPGLYFGGDDERVPKALRGIGVRIEDDVAITESGCEILTAAIPKQVQAVETWMSV